MNLTTLPLLFAQDADPFEGRELSNLEKHDKRFHPQGYNDGDFCKYRDALKSGDDADKLAIAEKEEGDAQAGVQKVIDRFNAVGILMMAQPLADEPYEKVFAEYGIKKGDKEFADAMSVITDAQEWFDANDDGSDLTSYRMKVLDIDDALTALKKPKAATPETPAAKPAPNKSRGGAAPSAPKSSVPREDLEDLHEIRDILESVARLLNGRTGNIPALQASSRWNNLNAVARHTKIGPRLDDLAKSSDKAVSSAATDLKKVFDNIVKSSRNNWNDPAGKVAPASALPQLPPKPYYGSCGGGSCGSRC